MTSQNSETHSQIATDDEILDRRDRKFAVSSNRGQASHRLRYVETGGAAVDTEDCTFCQVTPDLSDSDDKPKTD